MQVGQMRLEQVAEQLSPREGGFGFKAGLTLVGHSSPDIGGYKVINWRNWRAFRYCRPRAAQILD
jgi:hypothetical protein